MATITERVLSAEEKSDHEDLSSIMDMWDYAIMIKKFCQDIKVQMHDKASATLIQWI